MLGVSLEHVLHVLERFGSMPVLGPRPPTS